MIFKIFIFGILYLLFFEQLRKPGIKCVRGQHLLINVPYLGSNSTKIFSCGERGKRLGRILLTENGLAEGKWIKGIPYKFKQSREREI